MPDSDASELRTVPKLASDSWRTVVASSLAIIVAVCFQVGLQMWYPDSLQAVAVATYLFGFWLSFSVLYIVFALRAFAAADSETFHRWLARTTPRERERSSRFLLHLSGVTSVSLAIQGSIIAVFAVLAMSFAPEIRSSPVVIYMGIATVVGSWLLTSIAFAIQYARLNADAPGLVFPGDSSPAFLDFLYLAVLVSTTCATSDVSVTTTPLRRTVTTHSVIAFAFNTVIIAILVAGLVSIST